MSATRHPTTERIAPAARILPSMGDEPRFPGPEEAKPKARTPIAPAERKPIVVARAEPMAEEQAPAKPKLSPDEVRALLAVHEASRPTRGAAAWKRGRAIVIPTGLIGLAAHLFFGSWAPVVSIAATAAAIVWIARPLFRRDGFS